MTHKGKMRKGERFEKCRTSQNTSEDVSFAKVAHVGTRFVSLTSNRDNGSLHSFAL